MVFVATMVTVYGVVLVRPVMTHDVAPVAGQDETGVLPANAVAV